MLISNDSKNAHNTRYMHTTKHTPVIKETLTVSIECTGREISDLKSYVLYILNTFPGSQQSHFRGECCDQ